MDESVMKIEFSEWANNGGIESANSTYINHAIDVLEWWLDEKLPDADIGNLFRYTDIVSYREKITVIKDRDDFKEVNQKDGIGRPSAALKRYEEFLAQRYYSASKAVSKGEFEMSESNENARKLANLLLHTHNLILHGAPGTGKTHLAKEIAKEMGAEWEMVQFHPSYDYTDFVEGLRPIKTDDGNQIGFERKDGVFKEFCERALKSFEESPNENNFDDAWNKLIEEVRNNLANNKLTKIGSWEYGLSQTESLKYSSVDSPSKYSFTITRQNIFDTYSGKQARPKGGFQKDMELIVSYMKEHYNLANYKENIGQKKNDKPFLFIIDEINRGEISKIFGELFFSIDPGYRGEKGKISTQYQNLIEPSDVFADGFYVPENVYIIGTMNDIDRSVESMDFAFRRRFTFCEIKANENLGMLDELEEAIREEAKARLLNLNEAISKIEGLSSAYHIGGAYFLKLKELENGFYSLWDYHLKGLLREYLRGMEGADALLETLKSAYENHGLDSELA